MFNKTKYFNRVRFWGIRAVVYALSRDWKFENSSLFSDYKTHKVSNLAPSFRLNICSSYVQKCGCDFHWNQSSTCKRKSDCLDFGFNEKKAVRN